MGPQPYWEEGCMLEHGENNQHNVASLCLKREERHISCPLHNCKKKKSPGAK